MSRERAIDKQSRPVPPAREQVPDEGLYEPSLDNFYGDISF